MPRKCAAGCSSDVPSYRYAIRRGLSTRPFEGSFSPRGHRAYASLQPFFLTDTGALWQVVVQWTTTAWSNPHRGGETMNASYRAASPVRTSVQQ
jgi:hypothetical protein